MVIVILLLAIIAVLIVVSIFLALNYMKKEKTKKVVVEKEKVSIEPVLEGVGLCKNHNDKNSVGICAICEDEFCIDCLKQIDNISLCPEHFSLYASNTWIPITNQRTTPNDPNEGIYIYKFKQHLWKTTSIPTYILNEYKIQVENDYIETYVQLHVTEENKEKLSQELQQFKENLSNE
jgi:hypothetical protein